MADMIGRAVCRASRPSLGFVIVSSLQFPKSNASRKCIAVSAPKRFRNRFGLRFVAVGSAGVSARQVHTLSSNSSSPVLDEDVGQNRPGIEVPEDEGASADRLENGVSQLRELCAGKMPDYLLRR